MEKGRYCRHANICKRVGGSVSNLPMVIKNKDDSPGYVYLVRFNNAKDCFKIGSTGNIYRRMKSFGDKWNDVDLIAYGYASNRLLVERQIQWILKEFNNNQKLYKMWPQIINYQFRGDLNSTEHFHFDTITACNVIMLFDMLCNSVQVGTPHPVYGINPNCKSVGYGEELQKFYDPGLCRYVPYPTEFKHGCPVFKYADEWDNISHTKISNNI